MRDMIWHSKPSFSAAEQRAVARVLRSGYVSEGPVVRQFERRVAGSLGARDAVALSSGTAALHLALLALGVGPGDEVIAPTYVCTSVLDAIHYANATPRLVDITKEDLSIDPECARQAIGKKTKAIIVPHLFGIPAGIDRVRRLGVPVVEDAAQTIGIDYRGRPIGAWGDVAVLSFYATKMLTAGGYGGMLVSRKRKHTDLARDLRTFDERESYRVRWHYSMSEVQAAIGIEQWKRLPGFIEKRRAIAEKYLQAAPEGSVIGGGNGTFFRFLLWASGSATKLIKEFQDRGVQAKRPIFRPLHRYLKLDRAAFPMAELAYRHVASVPIYPAMTARECAVVRRAIREGMSE